MPEAKHKSFNEVEEIAVRSTEKYTREISGKLQDLLSRRDQINQAIENYQKEHLEHTRELLWILSKNAGYDSPEDIELVRGTDGRIVGYKEAKKNGKSRGRKSPEKAKKKKAEKKKAKKKKAK